MVFLEIDINMYFLICFPIYLSNKQLFFMLDNLNLWGKGGGSCKKLINEAHNSQCVSV